MQNPSDFYNIRQTKKNEYTISFRRKIDPPVADSLLKKIRSISKTHHPLTLTVDIGGVTQFDDFSAVTLLELKQLAGNRVEHFNIVNADSGAKNILSNVNFETCEIPAPIKGKHKSNPVVLLGESTIDHADNIRFLISFLGSVFLSFMRVLIHPKSLRTGDMVSYMEKTGVNAVPIVGLISFLLGLVIAFMSSLQLQQFGANIYVASLVSVAMVSELGPIMTAIVVAGRSGSAFAAEIGTMKISEEIDALVTMGFDPTLFLAVPRIIAACIVVPILTLFSDLFGIFGGLVVGIFMLNLTMGSYIGQTIKTLTLFEVMWGLMKSFVFAALIAWIGCLRGFQTRGGASAVGDAATSAVVSSIFLIILFDSFFAVLRSYWW
jgi:phospholipid/cholesterol/gamma-HCH transport system permease protein